MNTNERTYKKEEVITFRSTKESFGALSNMASGFSILVNDVIIPSSEALYQACRYPLFPAIQEEIINQNSPMTAKMISKKYYKYTRQDWEQKKYEIMYWVLKIKLLHNYHRLSELLRKTEEKPIVELSNKDRDWGAKEENGFLVGKNALGRLLMQLRKEFILEEQILDKVYPPKVSGFLLYNTEISIIYKTDLEMLFDIDLK